MHLSFVMTATDLHLSKYLPTRPFRIFALGVAMALASIAVAGAQDALFDTKAKQALMVEDQTGTILYAKSPDTLIEPAALAKLMTMEVVFHALKTGKITPDDAIYGQRKCLANRRRAIGRLDHVRQAQIVDQRRRSDPGRYRAIGQ